ncbi:MAG: acyl carrier protein [Clostridia bacterium]|nr:acyl carrier protein [Clostridia bacterium]
MVFDEISSMLAEQLNIEQSSIKPESRIIEDLHTDSLDLVEMLITLEDKYSISVPDEDAKNLTTVGKLVEYVEKKIAEKGE